MTLPFSGLTLECTPLIVTPSAIAGLEFRDEVETVNALVDKLRNEQGVELYYNARLTPWFQLTPDLQVVDPFQKQANPALVLGLRAKLDF